MDGHELAEVIGAVGIFGLLTTVITVTIIQIGANWRAKMSVAREREYRRLAEDGVAAQQRTERRLDELADRLVDIQTRVTAIERVLKEVE